MRPTDRILLEVAGLRAGYGTSPALFDVGVSVAAGELVVLIGPNGAGKSTLLKVVSGVLRPWQGSIVFDGTDVSALEAHQIVSRGIAHCPEGRRVFPALTVYENLRMGAYVRRKGGWPAELDYVYDLFPRLEERHRQVAGTLSGGEQQMLAIGRALMSQPSLLLLDEPSLGLAPVVVEQVMDAIRTIAGQGTTTLVVEQNANWGLSIADRAYVMEAGRIVKQGAAGDLRQDEGVRAAYLGL